MLNIIHEILNITAQTKTYERNKQYHGCSLINLEDADME
jgi:hypothetical protein